MFDETLNWLISTGEKEQYEMRASDSWGNYKSNKISYKTTSGNISSTSISSTTKIPSGSSEYTVANNVYDLAGNVYDWTLEAYSSSGGNGRYVRGGSCINGGSGSFAANRNYTSPNDSNSYCRF